MLTNIKLRALIGPNRWSSSNLLEVRTTDRAPQGDLILPELLAALVTWLHRRGLTSNASAPLPPHNWGRQLSVIIAALHRSAELDEVEFFFPPGGTTLLFTTVDPSLGHLSVDAALALCQVARMTREQKEEPFDNVLEVFHSRMVELGFDIPVRRMARAATALRLAHRRHSLLDGHYLIGEGRHQLILDASDTNHTAAMAKDIAANKDMTNALLAAYGFPVARQETVERSGDVWPAAQRVGLPAVVKPRIGAKGKGVSLDIKTQREAVLAFQAAQQSHAQVLVESTIPGQDHRIMVMGQGVIALKREAPAVTGDGIHTIAQLIARENSTRGRKRGDLRAIEVNADTDRLLAAAGRTMDTVLPAGEIQQLLMVPSASWPRRDVSHDIHPETRRMLVDAAALVGLDIASIDFRTPDIARSWQEVGGGICEIESRSGLWALVRAEGGVVEAFLRHLVAGRPLHIPHIVAIGRGDLSPLNCWAVELSSRARTQLNWRSAVLTSDRLEIAGQQVHVEPLSPARANIAATESPLVDLAVYVTTPEACLASGLGVQRPDIILIKEQDDARDLEPLIARTAAQVLPWERRDEVDALLSAFDPVAVRSRAAD